MKIKKSEDKCDNASIKDALLKKALGYETKETIEEYSIVEDKLFFVKKKVNTKSFPPDLDAIEIALKEDNYDSDYSTYSDEQLLAKKDELIDLYNKLKKGDKNECN